MDRNEYQEPNFNSNRHKKMLKSIIKGLRGGKHDSNRVIVAQFAVLGLDILGELDSLSQEFKERIINWVYSLQVSNDEELVSGFQSGSTMNSVENRGKNAPYKWGHITNTYSALVILLILGDDLSRVHRSSIIKSLRALQNQDGSFTAVRLGGTESDMRFVFCAMSICFILNDWSGVDLSKTVDYIIKSKTYEQGFGQGPDLECHSGSTFCAIASLYLSDHMNVLSTSHRKGLIRWLTNKSYYGFSGRTNKPIDTCYSFWTGGALQILGAYQFTAPYDFNRNTVLVAQHSFGGFSKYPDTTPDPLHTCLGLAGLSIMGIDSLQEVFVPLVITKRAYEHLKNVQANWQSS